MREISSFYLLAYSLLHGVKPKKHGCNAVNNYYNHLRRYIFPELETVCVESQRKISFLQPFDPIKRTLILLRQY